jgi:hypothetical protein
MVIVMVIVMVMVIITVIVQSVAIPLSYVAMTTAEDGLIPAGRQAYSLAYWYLVIIIA